MDEETAAKIFKVAVRMAKALNEVLDCDGMNILQNNGEAAGQTVMHFHMHIIPRYKGDTVNVGWKPGEADEAVIKDIIAKVQSKLN